MFKCKHCENTYKHRGSLTNHMRSHEDPKHQCEVCSKRFLRKAYLLKHAALHQDDRSGDTRDAVSDTRSAQMTLNMDTDTMVVPVKILSSHYEDFIEYLGKCQYVYLDKEINTTDDLDIAGTTTTAQAVGAAPPSAHPLMSPPDLIDDICLGIPTASHILGGIPSPPQDPDIPVSPFDLQTTEAEREFLEQLEKFIDEL